MPSTSDRGEHLTKVPVRCSNDVMFGLPKGPSGSYCFLFLYFGFIRTGGKTQKNSAKKRGKYF